MAGAVSFDISVTTENADYLPTLQNRLKHLEPVFEQVIKEWAGLNEDKFASGAHGEMGGAEVDPGVFWHPLAASTIKQKQRENVPDNLMVWTGELKDAMTSPDSIFQMVEAERAVFGTPLDQDDAAKVAYNWARRQTIFFGTADQNVVKRVLQKHLSEMDVPWTVKKAELGRMDADFANAIAPGDGDF